MPDKIETSPRQRVPVAWLSGGSPEIEALGATSGPLRRYSLDSAAKARATALRLSDQHEGLVVVEASCPAFMTVCRILSQSPNVQLVTVHPATRCMDAVTIPPAMCV